MLGFRLLIELAGVEISSIVKFFVTNVVPQEPPLVVKVTVIVPISPVQGV